MDIIREAGSQNHYYVIDINYFPGFYCPHRMWKSKNVCIPTFSILVAGFGKMPDFEYVFIDFLLKLSRRTDKLCSGVPRLEDTVQHTIDK
jgi:inositol-1,3,4-trisphosphate 5/6-kinase/inositol-tetrakisphosphate 1-kinase